MLISTILFNGGHFFIKLFNPFKPVILVGYSPLCGHFHNSIMIETMVMVLWGISAMHLGALWISYTNSKLKIKYSPAIVKDKRRDFWYISPNALKTAGYLLLVIAALPAFLWIGACVKIALSGGYKALFLAEIGYGSSIRILMTLLIPSIFLLLIGSRDDRKTRLLSVGLILLYSSAFFITGDRSKAIMPLLAYLWIWHIGIQKLSQKFFIVAGSFLLLVVLPIVQLVRAFEGYSGISFDTLIDILRQIENPAKFMLMTMGNSMGAIAHTIHLVPSVHNFGFGETYLRGISTIFPNLFWLEHPGSNFMGGDWFLWHVSPASVFSSRRGLGYSIIAEAYYNFGMFGVPFIMLLWGASVAKLTVWAQKGRYLSKIAFAGCFGAFIMQIPRGWIAYAFRPLVWYAFIPLVLARIIYNWQKQNISS